MSNEPCLNVASLVATLYNVYGGAPDGIIFDCDGVLVDSGPANVHYYNLLRRELRLPPINPEQERYVHMSTAEQALNAIIPAVFRPVLRDVMQRISYERDILPLLKPFEDLPDLLDACREHGLRLGVHTNRFDSMPSLLEHCGLAACFDPVITAAVAPAKPDPAGTRMILDQWGLPAGRVLFLGDSPTDRDAADGAGVPFLAFRSPDLSPLGRCCTHGDLLTALETIWESR